MEAGGDKQRCRIGTALHLSAVLFSHNDTFRVSVFSQRLLALARATSYLSFGFYLFHAANCRSPGSNTSVFYSFHWSSLLFPVHRIRLCRSSRPLDSSSLDLRRLSSQGQVGQEFSGHFCIGDSNKTDACTCPTPDHS